VQNSDVFVHRRAKSIEDKGKIKKNGLAYSVVMKLLKLGLPQQRLRGK
jgi:hypothetical protein